VRDAEQRLHGAPDRGELIRSQRDHGPPRVGDRRRLGVCRPHTTATFTQWIGGSESNRHSHSSPPS
jgi:hypothetical protein